MNFKPKKCIECGKEFVPRCGTQVYCDGPHVAVCQYCGKEFEYVTSPKFKRAYCSAECRELGKQKMLMDKYGVDNVARISEVRSAISAANSSEAVSSKRRATCMTRYGVDNVSKSAPIKEKLSEIMSGDEYLRGREHTCMKKYGAKSPMQTKEVQAKKNRTNLERYGSIGRIYTRDQFAALMIDGSKVDDYLAFKNDPASYISEHYAHKPSVRQLEMDLGVSNTPIYSILVKNGCNDMIEKRFSTVETDVYSFLCSLMPESDIVRNDRDAIKPMEIDLYIPKYKLGIECDPAWTHNSSIPSPWGQKPTPYTYHQKKSLKAQEAGIFLFHIFGYEWVNKRAIMQSMIRNILGMSERKIWARNTCVREVTDLDSRRFLDNNHKQGYLSSPIRLGLYTDDDELVSIMTFNPVRSTMGRSPHTQEGDYELSRYCSLLNTNVVGGAGKLLSHFMRNYDYRKIISFSDIAHTRGGLYESLGFSRVSVSEPSYVWTDIYDHEFHTRVSCQKRNLRSLFHDESIDIDKFTEAQIMEARGFVRVYDSGTIRWELEH